MTAVMHVPADPGLDVRGGRTYRRVLHLYPRAFRLRFGDEMSQAFADLMAHHAEGRPSGVWLRVAKDVLASVGRERATQLVGAGGRGPGPFLLLALLIAIGVTGQLEAVLYLLPLVIATIGITQLYRAWSVHHTTGASSQRRIIVGLTALALSAGSVIASGDDGGWLLGVSVILSLICGSLLGAIWAIRTLVAYRREHDGAHARRRAGIVLVLGVVVLGGMAGAAYNSYRKSQPPPGDHSVQNASAESLALWEAAWRGDVVEAARLIGICADPFVQFSGHGQVDFRARSVADWRAGGWGNEHPVADARKPQFRRVVALLQDAEDTWRSRCGGKVTPG